MGILLLIRLRQASEFASSSKKSPGIVQCCVGRVWTWKWWENPRWKAEIKMEKLSQRRQNTWRTRGTWEVRRGLIDGWPTYDGSVKGWWRKGNVHKTLMQWIARLFELEREATAFFFLFGTSWIMQKIWFRIPHLVCSYFHWMEVDFIQKPRGIVLCSMIHLKSFFSRRHFGCHTIVAYPARIFM
jgi:hypothetical protein